MSYLSRIKLHSLVDYKCAGQTDFCLLLRTHKEFTDFHRSFEKSVSVMSKCGFRSLLSKYSI